MLTCEPGKYARLNSFSLPQTHLGIIESLAVPERIEILPFR